MIHFNITTPERSLVNEEVDSVTLPTETGEITILNNHIPLVSNLIPGEVKYRVKNETKHFAVSGGFIEVKPGNKVIVLANTAEAESEIDIDRAEQAKEQAKKLMEQSRAGDESFAQAAAMLEKNLARLRVARKHRTHTQHNLESGVLHE